MKVELPDFSHLPDRISRLGEFAYNFWWSWNHDARVMLRSLDRTLWRNTQHNPVRMLREISPERLTSNAKEKRFLRLYNAALDRFDHYLASEETWFSKTHPDRAGAHYAYFCAEFAVHSSLPIYSGGLGLLAGDTCKEASDLGIPLVGIGCFYPEGYFCQKLEADGGQTAVYERLQTENTALIPVKQDDGRRFLVRVPVGPREIQVAVWRVQTGRVPIYLMDTNIPENEPWDRNLSMRLYAGDSHVRLRQEIVLGIGGVRVLRALGYTPSVIHLNEGHAAFATLELLRELVQQGHSFKEALEKVRATTCFTTHTPVRAGHDVFSFELMDEFFEAYWSQLDIERELFLKLGQEHNQHSFSMTILALGTSLRANAVSQRHGEASRQMWNFLWPEKKLEEVPITSITNGVHVPTWMAVELVPLMERYVGKGWRDNHDDPELWEKIVEIPDRELWGRHVRLKNKLFHFVRERARKRWDTEAISPSQIIALGSLLDPDALTIGFARRFTTYKRAALILLDSERLKRILNNPSKPVQIIFAGKAHPADEPGKHLLQRVFQSCASSTMGGRVTFIEDHDKHVAHHLVQGVDVWLNNPRPPQEASGTSGQKAALNGVPNFSVLDGWWCEGYNGKNGWAIEEGEDDAATADSIYDLLEQEIVPLFYQRDSNGIPIDWIKLMKEAIRSAAAPFSARRMVKQYFSRMYSTSSLLAEDE